MSEQTQLEALAPPDPPPSQTAVRAPLGELEDGQRVAGVYAVRERELRRKRNGEPWLRLSVGDATGTAEAGCWGDAELHYALCCGGSPVFVSGVFEISERWGAKIKVTAIREAEPDEYVAEALGAEWGASPELLESDLRELLGTVQNPQLGELLEVFFGEHSETW